jgi:hypothetical protein
MLLIVWLGDFACATTEMPMTSQLKVAQSQEQVSRPQRSATLFAKKKK